MSFMIVRQKSCFDPRHGDMRMIENGVYGRRLGDRFRLDAPPALVSRMLGTTEIAVTQIKCDSRNHGPTTPFPHEDSFCAALQMRGSPDREAWVDGRPLGKRPLAAGVTAFYDLKRNPKMAYTSPFHALVFYMPRKALDWIADDADANRIDDLEYQPGSGVDDPVIRYLGLSLLGAFERPGTTSHIFVDHVTLAVAIHVAHTYGGMRLSPRSTKGALVPWQERRVTEMLSAKLDGRITLRVMATECGLSVSHFCRAFRRATGMSPNQWLQRRRIDAAKALLRDRQVSLVDVALRCGFSDQSHFTRVYTHIVGTSPGAWRRALDQ
jgi:AraC family transcriptional regulator